MRSRVAFRSRARRVRLILLDVDGVLTDGGLAFGSSGREGRTFHVRDGAGLAIARRLGFLTGFLSGREGADLRQRARELRVDEVHLGTRDKLSVYAAILARRRLTDDQVCYMGDDLVDLPVLARAGVAAAPADAHPDVLRSVPFVTRAAGGRGAVREVIDAIVRAQGKMATVLGWFAEDAS